MSTTKGQLTNLESGEALKFATNPTQFRMNRQFDFAVDPLIGQPASAVSYRSGGTTALAFQLRFDKDVADKSDPAEAYKFLSGLNKVVEAKKSVPQVKFALGTFNFTGYLSQFTYQPMRFDDKGNATSALVDLNLISDGSYEAGK